MKSGYYIPPVDSSFLGVHRWGKKGTSSARDSEGSWLQEERRTVKCAPDNLGGKTCARAGGEKKCKVTIGLCVKNSEKTIREAMNSIINQDFPHELMELIVVDGESKDKTMSIITDCVAETDMQVKMRCDKGEGLGVARQIAVDDAGGEFIVWVDGDVIIPKDFVQKQVEFMQKNPHTAIAGARVSYEEGPLVAALENLYCYVEPPDAWIGSNICRVEALRQVGGFDRRIRGTSEDVDLTIRIKAADWSISINHEAKFCAGFRETWRGFFDQRFQYGYGDHFVSHKHRTYSYDIHKHRICISWYLAPLMKIVGGVRRSLEAFKLTRQKKSFLIPLLVSFGSVAWWLGFGKSNMNGYGH